MLDDDTTKAADDAAAEPAAEEENATEEQPAEAATEQPAEDAAPEAQSAGTDQHGRTLYTVKCSNCGKETQVPFQPSGGRPVYCRDCYMQKKNA